MPVKVRRIPGFAEIALEGSFFTNDPSRLIVQNTASAVEDLAKQGATLVKAALASGIQKPTGFTRRNIEGFAYKRTRVRTGGNSVTVYGKVRMKPGLRRGSRSGPHYSPANVPYIIERVLESGAYGGYQRYGGRSGGRSKMIWISGFVAQHKRRELGQFRKSATVLRHRARSFRADLTKGLS